ncbi:hypothetical protein KIN20_006548 [Parelaphostrongylus tenuis]|uniref:Uncharacterized protein n=1 Tax=Parelaphostrongylus tenuis TaxID=148309 RepID=A0AAD5M1X0_PARTN|nr:hypothetical protein KIN20_006548 [Parelaphostrongylus tenuis]
MRVPVRTFSTSFLDYSDFGPTSLGAAGNLSAVRPDKAKLVESAFISMDRSASVDPWILSYYCFAQFFLYSKLVFCQGCGMLENALVALLIALSTIGPSIII